MEKSNVILLVKCKAIDLPMEIKKAWKKAGLPE